jgi:hypothetical protein
MNVRSVDLALVSVLGGQITGVKAATRHAVKGMSAAGRSGPNEHRVSSQPRVSKWPDPENFAASKTRLKLRVQRKCAI